MESNIKPYLGKTAVVTGAGGTLCSLISEKLALCGAHVVLVGRTASKLELVAEVIKSAGGSCETVCCDVTDEAAVEAAASNLEICDYLINGAGGNNPRAVTTIESFCDEELSSDFSGTGFFSLDCGVLAEVIKINTMGTLIPCKAFAKRMKNGGAIVNFASMNSYKPLTKVPAYAMSKAAIVNFTEWLAAYLAPAGIRVNAVAPGFFVNDRSRKILMSEDGGLSARGERVLEHTPQKRFGNASDLWGCIDLLLDEKRSGFVTGVTIPVDGGFSAHPGI